MLTFSFLVEGRKGKVDEQGKGQERGKEWEKRALREGKRDVTRGLIREKYRGVDEIKRRKRR